MLCRQKACGKIIKTRTHGNDTQQILENSSLSGVRRRERNVTTEEHTGGFNDLSPVLFLELGDGYSCELLSLCLNTF